MESLRYYRSQKRIQRRKRLSSSSSSSICYNIVYNAYRVKKEEEGEKEDERRRLSLPKHVHPKLPDYDQIVAQFTAFRTQHRIHS